MSEILSTIEAALAAIPYPAQPDGLYAPIRYVLQGGGKRLRPTLLLLAYRLYAADIARALPAAVGLEMYHNHTLLHDDVMDRADVRRGRPTVHRVWNENTAILSGDAMLLMAVAEVGRTDCPRTRELQAFFVDCALRICEGQQYDVDFESRTDVTEAEYIEMIRLKTSVLLGCATKMGAMMAGATPAEQDALYRFAEHIGLAFQIQDDWLDTYGDPAVFGKKIGGDILCGKKTYLLINALRMAGDAERTELLGLLADAACPPDEKIRRVTDLYNRLGIPAIAEAAIRRHFEAARREWETVGGDAEARQALWDYAESLLGRTS